MTRKKQNSATSSSLSQPPCEFIAILESFGIKTRVEYEFLNSDHVANFQNFAMQRTLPSREDFFLAEHCNPDRTQLAICFTCESSQSCSISSGKRLDTITIRVQAFYKDFIEDIKQLPTSPYEILNSLVSIVDVDHDRKHVYIQVKRNMPESLKSCLKSRHLSKKSSTKTTNETEYWEFEDGTQRPQNAYYMMGRVDNKSCFLMNLDKYYYHKFEDDEHFKHFKSINDMYRASTLYNKCDKMTKHGKRTGQAKGSNVKRVFFSTYFVSGAKDSYNNYIFKHTIIRSWSNDPNNEANLGNGISTSQHIYRHYMGKVDFGLYEMELKSWSTFKAHRLIHCLEPEIIHIVTTL
ncbi:hypothetical protein C9374_003960 [Naegleria lovaniensis]|uniref:Uncharacterized protein n=1 Tax=Naegleria lovaniensis TaxID=51637 RepID=A0AA88H8T2_NAELO|nr:uncharacterized protein C9374_003960 [Naegleria lovaniensis]KAG2394196.1 hypothetical protein C9374_003960 [Naegleria lovaniensis]